MYCPDTLERLNENEVQKQTNRIKKTKFHCDFCDGIATHVLPVYNPADALRDVVGAYCTLSLCDECKDNLVFLDDGEYFFCDGCGELFISHHSWDVLSVTTEKGVFCQKCAADNLEPIPLSDLIESLLCGNVDAWTRINSVPGKELIYTCEYSQYSDFPGKTSLASIAGDLRKLPISLDELVYPIIDHGYQFSVSLSIYL